ncbi:MAG: hypoxanthine phosphoribosyltransferase [Prevotellaceae bacterium]|jgi:hypoxanthine phosphoribosyltransferase|nr:hypoxanthine phosphoribosyltransferase [Prevotellaceae bacterium]
MKRVKLHDKEFEIAIRHDQIQTAIGVVAQKIREDMKGEPVPVFLSILNGSFMFTADLLKQMDFNCEVSFVKLESYSGVASTGKVQELLGLNTDISGRTVIIVEDIVDTGNTLVELVEVLKKRRPKQIKVATFLLKPEAYDKDIPIDYVGMKIPNDFIVGYGLDYDQLGRNLRNIYKIVN